MMKFQHYIGIDYSGAATPRSRTATIQVYHSTPGCQPEVVHSPAATIAHHRNWNRSELADWLAEFFDRHDHAMVGIDHGLAFPQSYLDRYGLASWDEFLSDFVRHWPTHQGDCTVEQFRRGSNRFGDSSELRLTERWTSAAKSVFQFDVQGSVAKSTHAGLPYIQQLRASNRQIHFWPFDGWHVQPGVKVVAEVWPSILRNRYPRDSRTIDQQDAYSVSRWLQEMDSLNQLDRFFIPPLTDSQRKQAILEGWILGVT